MGLLNILPHLAAAVQMMRIRYAVTKPEDFIRFGISLRDDVRAIGITAWAGRRAVGLGGIVLDSPDGAMGHFGVAPDYHAVVIRGLHRRALVFLRRIAATRVQQIWATCDADNPRAEPWLVRLGFAPNGETYEGSPVFIRRMHP